MSKVINQGEDYEEDLVDEEYDEESDEDTDSKLSSLFGIPVKFLILGGAALLLVLIIVIVFALRGGGDEDDIVMPDSGNEVVQPDASVDTNVPVQTPVQDQTQQPAAPTTATMTWSDASGTVVGTTEGDVAEGVAVYKDGVQIGTFSFTSGTAVTSDSGWSGFVVLSGQTPTASGEQELDIVTTLRKLGYTGDEIQAAQASGADLNAMADEARKLQDEAAKEALIRMSNSASEEFQYLLNYSIFNLPKIEFPQTENTFDRVMKDGNYIVNADYEKLDTYGNQLIVKLKIANNTYAFMVISPDRWSTLPDTGNMVVRINYTLFGMKNTSIEMYITSIEEIDVTQITVNPEDSARDIDDIVNIENIISGDIG